MRAPITPQFLIWPAACFSFPMISRTRQLIWTTHPPSPARLRREGYHVCRYPTLRDRILACRTAGTRRSGLENPASAILDLFRRKERVAVLDVGCDARQDLPLVYAYLVEPAFRCGCRLLIGADQEGGALEVDGGETEAPWGHPWSRERLGHLLAVGRDPVEVPWPEPVPRWRRWFARLFPRADGDEAGGPLDPEQMAAVNAGDGVVQIIAPAGSGKTTVLIRRVRELQRRGSAPESILCMSFNRDAAVEIGQRLERAGLKGVHVRSFHAMGLALLREEGHLRDQLGEMADEELEDLVAAVFATAEGVRTPGLTEARNLISSFKLARMVTPAEARASCDPDDPAARLPADLYAAYEATLEGAGRLDFDDLIARSVRLLQQDRAVRRRWQARFERVLVDEYQDIEPAQALLVGLLAAPQDSLFCVGDEDQCIYAWRRATVRRIIELDQVYPGLERHALVRNYRCGRRIVAASRRLIRHNQVRFRKPLHAGAAQDGWIAAAACRDRSAGAALVAWLISDATGDEVAVLARTARLLTEVRAACARLGVDPGRVEMATMHASKGREWDRVIIFGADEGQAPHGASLREREIEAERRLFYVALTRAKRRLEIVCTSGKESRFLKEAGIGISNIK